jgi:hypothetical protein
MATKGKKKSELFNTIEFVKYKASVIGIVGAADWKKATFLYIKRYKDFDSYRAGYVKLMTAVDVVKRSVDQNPGQPIIAKAKHLNKTLTAALNLLKADGFPKVGGKAYKAEETDIKENTLDGDQKPPAYGKREGL